MKKKGKIREWLWLILPALFLLGIGTYFVSEMLQDSEEEPVEEKVLPAEENNFTEDELEDLYEEEESIDKVHIEPPPVTLPDEPSYIPLEKQLAEFFSDLDTKSYIQKLGQKPDTLARFKNIVKRLRLDPPTPAGEVRNPNTMLRNICYFYRVLGPKDIRMIAAIIANEKETTEIDLRMFYRCFTLDGQCPGFESLRPSKEVMYRFAGFFLNTIGGRAYLFRRTPAFRILLGYYCVLIIHDADKRGGNTYGIDVVPHIKQIKQEVIRYPEFQFHKEYIQQLDMMEGEYLEKRETEDREE